VVYVEGVALSNESIIVVQNLTKVFGDFLAVDDITFDMKKGEIFGLLGPNGTEKAPLFGYFPL
jgi:ABC-2 type transport system ATP-binding protein